MILTNGGNSVFVLDAEGSGFDWTEEEMEVDANLSPEKKEPETSKCHTLLQPSESEFLQVPGVAHRLLLTD